MVKTEAGVGQGILLPYTEGVPELPEDFDLTKKVTASRLIAAIAINADLEADHTTEQDLARVNPAIIQTGLVIGTAEARILSSTYEVQSVFQGIGFSPIHYTKLNRSPQDLAESTISKTKKANALRGPDKRLTTDEAEEVANRSAGHALEGLAASQSKVIEDVATQLTTLRVFRNEILSGGRAHYSAGNLDRIRKIVDTVILTDVEIAYLNRVWTGQPATIDALRRAVQYNLYGRRGHNNTRLTYWRQYVSMAGQHTRRQLAVARFGLKRTKDELTHFTPALERAREQLDNAS